MTEPTPLPISWLAWHAPAADGARNMARDAAMLAHVREHVRAQGTSRHGLLRCYGWTRPTVSFGRNEATVGRFDAASIVAAGLDSVRRPTGGHALLHGRELTYAVALPMADGASWRAAYDAVNALLCDALRRFGIAAEIVGDAAPPASRPTRSGTTRDATLCFAAPAVGEIVVQGAKLAGSAVWRERGAYLQHGSILVRDDQYRLADAARGPVPPLPPAATLSGLLGDARADALTSADFTDAFCAVLGEHASVTRAADGPSMDAEADALADHFRDPRWLWRR